MKRVTGLLLLIFIFTPLAYGATFSYPPETYYPDPPGWVFPFPYPRNIFWDFETNPFGGPSPEGAPGVEYAGWSDSILKANDFVSFTGDAQWYSSLSDIPGTGLIGIDNRSGSTALSCKISFYITNTVDPGPKHIWIEWDSHSLDLDPSVGVGEAYQSNEDEHGGEYYDGWWHNYMGISISPNPPSEEISWEFSVEPGEKAVINNISIATECIPEPTTVLLFGAGLFGLAGVLKTRK